jgi:hypothetical protein
MKRILNRSLVVISGLAVVLVVLGVVVGCGGQSGPSAAQKADAASSGKSDGMNIADQQGSTDQCATNATGYSNKKLKAIYLWRCHSSFWNESDNLAAQAQATEQANVGSAVDAFNASDSKSFVSDFLISGSLSGCGIDYNPDNSEVRAVFTIEENDGSEIWIVTTLDLNGSYQVVNRTYGPGGTLAGSNRPFHDGHDYNCSMAAVYNPSNPYLQNLTTDYTPFTG